MESRPPRDRKESKASPGKGAPSSCGGKAPAACDRCGGKAASGCPFCHKNNPPRSRKGMEGSKSPSGAIRTHDMQTIILSLGDAMKHLQCTDPCKSDSRTMADRALDNYENHERKVTYTIHAQSLFVELYSQFGWTSESWRSLERFETTVDRNEITDFKKRVRVFLIDDSQLKELQTHFLPLYVQHMKQVPDSRLERLIGCVTITNKNAVGINFTSTHVVFRLADPDAFDYSWRGSDEKMPHGLTALYPARDIEFMRKNNMTLYRMDMMRSGTVNIHTSFDQYGLKSQASGAWKGFLAAFSRDADKKKAQKAAAESLHPEKYAARILQSFVIYPQ